MNRLAVLSLLILVATPALAKTAPGDVAAKPENAAPVTPAAPFGGDSSKPFNVDADQSLEWRQNENLYIARGHAKVTRDDFTIVGDTLTAIERPKKIGTGKEIWKFTAEKNVVISNGKANAYGDHGVYDIDSQTAVLTGDNLHMVTNDDTLTATDRFEYHTAEHKAVAVGHAVAIRAPQPGQPDSGRTVKADTMTTYFVEDAHKNLTADHVEAEGHVTIITATDVATGDHATYNMNAGNAVLTGNVRLARGKSQLEGDRAEVDFKTGVSRLLSGGKGDGKTGRVHGLLVPGQDGATVMPTTIKKN